MSDFAAGFSAGSSAGNAIQNRLLAKKLRELENTRYEDEKAEGTRQFDTTTGLRRDELAARNRQMAIDEQLRREELAARLSEAEKARQQHAAEYRDSRGDAILGQLGAALKAGRDNRRLAAEIEKIKAQADYYRNGGSAGFGRSGMGYEEYGPDGELLKRHLPVGAVAGAPAAGGQEQLSPEAQEIAYRIAALQTGIGKQKVEMAGGDLYSGFLGLGGSRQGKIDAAQREIAKLQGMQRVQAQPQGGGAPQAQPGAQPTAIDAEMQRRGFVKGPDGKWIKPAQ